MTKIEIEAHKVWWLLVNCYVISTFRLLVIAFCSVVLISYDKFCLMNFPSMRNVTSHCPRLPATSSPPHQNMWYDHYAHYTAIVTVLNIVDTTTGCPPTTWTNTGI